MCFTTEQKEMPCPDLQVNSLEEAKVTSNLVFKMCHFTQKNKAREGEFAKTTYRALYFLIHVMTTLPLFNISRNSQIPDVQKLWPNRKSTKEVKDASLTTSNIPGISP